MDYGLTEIGVDSSTFPEAASTNLTASTPREFEFLRSSSNNCRSSLSTRKHPCIGQILTTSETTQKRRKLDSALESVLQQDNSQSSQLMETMLMMEMRRKQREREQIREDMRLRREELEERRRQEEERRKLEEERRLQVHTSKRSLIGVPER